MRTEELKLINCYVDKKNPKFELNGALLDKTNKKIVATNTRALIICDNAGLGADGIIHKSAIELALKSATATKPKNVWFHNRDGAMYHFGSSKVIDIQTTIIDGGDNKEGVIVSMPEINGKYPNYERVLFDMEAEDVKVIPTDKTKINRDIAMAGVIIDNKWLDPMIDYMKATDNIATVYFKHHNMPLIIKCWDITLAIMPIVVDKD